MLSKPLTLSAAAGNEMGAPATHKLDLLCLSSTSIHLSPCFYLFTLDFFFSAIYFPILFPMASIHFCSFPSLVSVADFFFSFSNSFPSLEAIFSQPHSV